MAWRRPGDKLSSEAMMAYVFKAEYVITKYYDITITHRIAATPAFLVLDLSY